MLPESQSWLMLPVMTALIALPAAAAWRRRRASREASAVAIDLAAFAAAVRAAARCLPMDESLKARVIRLRVVESASLHLAQELAPGTPTALADAAQRLASRLRRRVAFERKMLARTAPGLRRGALVASLPPLLLWMLPLIGTVVPANAQLALMMAEAGGCLLLWRLARVEI